jgi:hypothetical protein
VPVPSRLSRRHRGPPMIMELPQLISCGSSMKNEILLDHGARRVRASAHGSHGHHAPLKPTALRATRSLLASPCGAGPEAGGAPDLGGATAEITARGARLALSANRAQVKNYPRGPVTGGGVRRGRGDVAGAGSLSACSATPPADNSKKLRPLTARRPAVKPVSDNSKKRTSPHGTPKTPHLPGSAKRHGAFPGTFLAVILSWE